MAVHLRESPQVSGTKHSILERSLGTNLAFKKACRRQDSQEIFKEGIEKIQTLFDQWQVLVNGQDHYISNIKLMHKTLRKIELFQVETQKVAITCEQALPIFNFPRSPCKIIKSYKETVSKQKEKLDSEIDKASKMSIQEPFYDDSVKVDSESILHYSLRYKKIPTLLFLVKHCKISEEEEIRCTLFGKKISQKSLELLLLRLLNNECESSKIEHLFSFDWAKIFCREALSLLLQNLIREEEFEKVNTFLKFNTLTYEWKDVFNSNSFELSTHSKIWDLLIGSKYESELRPFPEYYFALSIDHYIHSLLSVKCSKSENYLKRNLLEKVLSVLPMRKEGQTDLDFLIERLRERFIQNTLISLLEAEYDISFLPEEELVRCIEKSFRESTLRRDIEAMLRLQLPSAILTQALLRFQFGSYHKDKDTVIEIGREVIGKSNKKDLEKLSITFISCVRKCFHSLRPGHWAQEELKSNIRTGLLFMFNTCLEVKLDLSGLMLNTLSEITKLSCDDDQKRELFDLTFEEFIKFMGFGSRLTEGWLPVLHVLVQNSAFFLNEKYLIFLMARIKPEEIEKNRTMYIDIQERIRKFVYPRISWKISFQD